MYCQSCERFGDEMKFALCWSHLVTTKDETLKLFGTRIDIEMRGFLITVSASG